MKVGGNFGYEEIADSFIDRTDTIPFEAALRPILHLLPPAPARILDIGAAHGRISAGLAMRGFAVTAVEPTDVFRELGMERHPDLDIAWFDDALPQLGSLTGREAHFNLILAIAMWMHLNFAERRAAMGRIASLLAPNGLFVVTLRHGPFPDKRVGYEVSADETLAHAQAEGLSLRMKTEVAAIQDANRRLGVTWTWLAFGRP